ncbi:MAG: DUF4124 domain-containing protein [Burkholderiales bacterium]
MQPTFKSAFAALVLLLAADAEAQQVYKSVDEAGRIVYTDRPPASKDPAATVKLPPRAPSLWEYESARRQAEWERVYTQRLEYENRMPAPTVVYDPHGLQRPYTPPPRQPGLTVRRDPNLPDTPAPTTNRDYYYGGR